MLVREAFVIKLVFVLPKVSRSVGHVKLLGELDAQLHGVERSEVAPNELLTGAV